MTINSGLILERTKTQAVKRLEGEIDDLKARLAARNRRIADLREQLAMKDMTIDNHLHEIKRLKDDLKIAHTNINLMLDEKLGTQLAGVRIDPCELDQAKAWEMTTETLKEG